MAITKNQTRMLDGYAEGTWTPTISNGTVSSAQAKYIKVGNLVHLYITDLSFSDTTTDADIQVFGIPYAPVTSQHAGSAFWKSVDAGKTGNSLWIDTVINTNTPFISFYLDTGASTYISLKHADLTDSNNQVQFTATYITA